MLSGDIINRRILLGHLFDDLNHNLCNILAAPGHNPLPKDGQRPSLLSPSVEDRTNEHGRGALLGLLQRTPKLVNETLGDIILYAIRVGAAVKSKGFGPFDSHWHIADLEEISADYDAQFEGYHDMWTYRRKDDGIFIPLY